jgi:hypothetical protein
MVVGQYPDELAGECSRVAGWHEPGCRCVVAQLAIAGEIVGERETSASPTAARNPKP